MKIKSKNSNYDYDYSFRKLRLYRPESYTEFSAICKKNHTSATREINVALEHAVKNNLLLSEVIGG